MQFLPVLRFAFGMSETTLYVFLRDKCMPNVAFFFAEALQSRSAAELSGCRIASWAHVCVWPVLDHVWPDLMPARHVEHR